MKIKWYIAVVQKEPFNWKRIICWLFGHKWDKPEDGWWTCKRCGEVRE